MKHVSITRTLRSEHLHVFQDDFCQQVFEVLVEIFRKESQNRLGRGQVTECRQPGEAVQSLEQLQDRRGALGGEEKWGRGQGTGLYPLPATHCHSHSMESQVRRPVADADAHVRWPASKLTCCFRR